MNEELKGQDLEELFKDGVNIRLFTESKQLKNNTSGVKGVSFNKQIKKYQVYITINRKRINLGVHKTLEEAKLVRLEAEGKYKEEILKQKFYEKTRKKTRSDSKTGVKGVRQSKETGKYHAYIMFNKKSKFLGSFTTLEEAINARRKGEIEYFKQIIESKSENNDSDHKPEAITKYIF